MIVRRASESDTADIERVARTAWRVDYPEVLHRENTAEAATDWYDDATIARAIERPDTGIYVASLGNEVVGFAHTYIGEDRGDILRLYVAPGYRQQGVGTALLDRAVMDLFEMGAEAVRAMVLAANDRGRAFYEDAGFGLGTEDAETVIDGETHAECRYRLDKEQWAAIEA